MFSSADIQQAIIKSHRTDSSSIQIASLVKNNTKRIRNRVESMQRAVDSDHLLVKLLIGIGYKLDWTYEDIEWRARRKLVELGNALNLSSPGNYGEVRVGDFIEGQQEFIVLTAQPINPRQRWQDIQAVRYLYHDYTNLNWEFGAPNGGRGFSFIEINLVALAYQYRMAMEWYEKNDPSINTRVYAYRHVVYRMLPSYMDLAMFNRSRFKALGLPVEKDVDTREYAIPQFEPFVTRHVDQVNEFLKDGYPLPGTVLNTIPLYFDGGGSALKLIAPVERGITTQHRWIYRLVNFSLMRFVVCYDNASMVKYYSTLKRELKAFEQLRILDKLPSSTQKLLDLTVFLPLYDVIG